MKALTFSIENCDTLIPDERRRVLGSEARKFASAGVPPRTRWKYTGNYWADVVKVHERIFWMDCYNKRRQRMKRMGGSK